MLGMREGASREGRLPLVSRVLRILELLWKIRKLSRLLVVWSRRERATRSPVLERLERLVVWCKRLIRWLVSLRSEMIHLLIRWPLRAWEWQTMGMLGEL